MKKISPYVTVGIIVLVIIILFLSMSKSQNMTVVYLNNKNKKPIEINLNKFQDSDCGMVIDDITYVSQVISPSGKTWFFHDHGGMAHWLKNKKFKDEATIWVMTKDTKRYVDGRKAWYSRTDETPMHYGFGAYEYQRKDFINFETMFLYMARGEHLANPKIRVLLLGKK